MNNKPDKYLARVDDLLLHVNRLGVQHLYRVVSIQLGGEDQEGVVEVASVNHESSVVDNHGKINSYIPHLMFADMVDQVILECIWRTSESRHGGQTNE